MMSALGIVLTKLISKKVEKLIILFYLGVASSMCGSIGLFTLGHPSCPGLDEWVLAVTIGILGLVQQYVLVWAVQVYNVLYSLIVYQNCVNLESYLIFCTTSWSLQPGSQLSGRCR